MNLKNFKDKINESKYALAVAATPLILEVQDFTAFATGGIKVPKVSVSDDGTVDLGSKGGSGTDIKSAFNTLIGNAQFVLGAIVTVVSLIMIGYGFWKVKTASQLLQDNNASGWQAAGGIVKGLVVGGILLATLGVILAASAASGANFF